MSFAFLNRAGLLGFLILMSEMASLESCMASSLSVLLKLFHLSSLIMAMKLKLFSIFRW